MTRYERINALERIQAFCDERHDRGDGPMRLEAAACADLTTDLIASLQAEAPPPADTRPERKQRPCAICGCPHIVDAKDRCAICGCPHRMFGWGYAAKVASPAADTAAPMPQIEVGDRVLLWCDMDEIDVKAARIAPVDNAEAIERNGVTLWRRGSRTP